MRKSTLSSLEIDSLCLGIDMSWNRLALNLARQFEWWARQDSNLQPDRYERPALTIELQAPPQAAARAARQRCAHPLQCGCRSGNAAFPVRNFRMAAGVGAGLNERGGAR